MGADLEFKEDGFNCLLLACFTQKPELVELLLKAGANPNCVSDEQPESLLDVVEFDQFYEENENLGGGEPLAKIVQLLKDYGAKSITALFAEKPQKFITVFASNPPTGLNTLSGCLKPEKIPNADKQFLKDFSKWVIDNPDKVDEYKYTFGNKILNPPDISVLRTHYEQGLMLARHIKSLVGDDIVVKYNFINADDIQSHNLRNVEELII